MILGIGTDIAEVHRVKNSIEKYGEQFLVRIFTDEERHYCDLKANRFERYAARFAAKEAFSKAIGTGWSRGFVWKEVGVSREPSGKPILKLSGGLLEKWGDKRFQLSLTHTKDNAFAVVIMESA